MEKEGKKENGGWDGGSGRTRTEKWKKVGGSLGGGEGREEGNGGWLGSRTKKEVDSKQEGKKELVVGTTDFEDSERKKERKVAGLASGEGR